MSEIGPARNRLQTLLAQLTLVLSSILSIRDVGSRRVGRVASRCMVFFVPDSTAEREALVALYNSTDGLSGPKRS
jgi:hypothetical protein